jgi:hypothetical protein
MFSYWSAPPSLLRIWACPEEPDPAYDDKLHFRSLVILAGEGIITILGRMGCSVQALLSSRVADTRLSGC